MLINKLEAADMTHKLIRRRYYTDSRSSESTRSSCLVSMSVMTWSGPRTSMWFRRKPHLGYTFRLYGLFWSTPVQYGTQV